MEKEPQLNSAARSHTHNTHNTHTQSDYALSSNCLSMPQRCQYMSRRARELFDVPSDESFFFLLLFPLSECQFSFGRNPSNPIGPTRLTRSKFSQSGMNGFPSPLFFLLRRRLRLFQPVLLFRSKRIMSIEYERQRRYSA